MAARHSFSVLVAMSLSVSACDPPVLDGLVESSGPPRSLVMVQGSAMILSRVVWDAGLSTEREVPGGFLGGFLFSVPPDASQGPHPVALRNDNGTSAPLTFTVTEPVPFGAPRLDRVSLWTVTFPADSVTAVLYVQGANMDVGAAVQVNGTDVLTVAHQGLQSVLYGANPRILGYPIYHHLAAFAVAPTLPAGSTITVSVRNLDGQASGTVSYTLPMDAGSLDSDGDNLWDQWEIRGYDANGDRRVDLDLPGLGTNPYRPDILVEVDVMEGLDHPPGPATFDASRAMFAAAPVLNPTWLPGVNLILDATGTVPFAQRLSFDVLFPGDATTTDFFDLKAAAFDSTARGRIFHYAIWGNALPGNYSGIADADLDGAGPGDDFLVSFDDYQTLYHRLRPQVETFVHELGHALAQRHGGSDNGLFQPNYWSVMSYAWQGRSAVLDSVRRAWTTCTPIYWADPEAGEDGGARPATVNAVVDYSHGMGPVVNEGNQSLDEQRGVCGVPVYWDGNLNTNGFGMSLDADDDGVPNELLVDVANWPRLNFRGPQTNGLVNR
jgi:hypothetical protein